MTPFASKAERGAAKPCAFCAIISGVGEAQVVAEDDATLAFLDRSPLLKGHVLVVPRAHIATLPEADDETLGALMRQVRNVAAVLPKALGADGSFVAQNTIVSQSVPHLHVHVVPRWRGDRLFSHNLAWRRLKYDPGEAEQIATAIRAALQEAD